ncbi:5' nucleotidase, NT5C type [Eudoraea sp.]|uniref:5' nucleotidase, NT5C type n=1 Tax=Eudoraea sp. TaxID=1979955 RepID=UPI003C74F00F
MTLFIDMDEVLADTYGAHIEHYNKIYNEKLTKQDCMGSEVWQSVPKSRQKSIHKHCHEEGFFRDLLPIADSIEVLKDLNKVYEVYIASAAMQFPNSLIEKHYWLEEYFPFIPWKQRILCGDKHILRGDILIDDRKYNLESFSGRSIIFTSPHNINTNGFERVNTWQEVATLLL